MVAYAARSLNTRGSPHFSLAAKFPFTSGRHKRRIFPHLPTATMPELDHLKVLAEYQVWLVDNRPFAYGLAAACACRGMHPLLFWPLT